MNNLIFTQSQINGSSISSMRWVSISPNHLLQPNQPKPPHFHCYMLTVSLCLLNARYNSSSSTSVSSIHRIIIQRVWENIQCFLVNEWWTFIFFSVTSGFCLATLPWSLFLSLADCGDMNAELQIFGEILTSFPFLVHSQPLRHSTHSPQNIWSVLCTYLATRFWILQGVIWLALHFCVCALLNSVRHCVTSTQWILTFLKLLGDLV